MKAINTKIMMATPATLPTTPPTMTGGDAMDEFEVPLPEPAVLDDVPPLATPVPPAYPPPTTAEVFEE
jgi:hypothetical protein